MTEASRQETFSGTKEVAEALRFDTSRLEEYLAKHIPDFQGPLTVEQFKGGQSNPTYKLTTPGRAYVLRRKPPGKLLASAHAVDREYRAMAALYPQGYPVPKPYLYCEDESVTGTAFFVMGFGDGRILWEADMPTLSGPVERAQVFDAMNATLAQLHTYDPEKIGLGTFGRPENYVARQTDRWTKQYRLSETEKIDDMERLIEWLPKHLPPEPKAGVVHGDYRIDNMILDPEKPKVIAVLDWELSTIGDPLADFTYHMMQWSMPRGDGGPGSGSLLGLDLAKLGIPTKDEYIEAYSDRTGLDPRPYFDVYTAYNFFRLAGILQGIMGRVRDGTATSAHAAARGKMVRPLAAAGWDYAKRAGAK
ncbi:putative aminoglycoside phosphotransferase [Variibacter gotjawalensis]|uniref:Putative aminoglycoside phosphotransferase n=1 Tax=Variibacter gotjawalensis TaxID=1333996 RepID=A0A0S3PPT8_9BRAD|nr:phosphotransferase family protein [Variibacter gotjawalensis]NIK48198.1 aminoglycoside phosphotransferase (APT) family kinase protein [Variibacter gotjawalensis]RZS50069.1 aminoglycoside phosphotransferase (APT) family kinase protein [Variibacter gotjawalensis]BAT57900.1 putative aminoglycoside phosphotransferase [Variibacter gotjawalensis]